ncbi:hypothetical protein FIBSPDRAFT_920321 [Athelia psychrophila]|uniref:Mid2 domain-containing protein n=1 Tax=Athelia psychrophila TaxID=1759441 RepID=A0A166HC11_9AGAM|nr:hypothetical protein FIBSPDRAFT_920321 [Fibularhizoctonia sp. CBS 109695]
MQFRFVQQSCAFFLQLFILSHLLHLGTLHVDAAPTGLTSHRTSVVRRDDANNSQPTTVTTVTQVNTANGPVTQTCKITLTPITVDGQQQVEEVKDCTLSSDSGGGSSSAAGSDTTSIATSTIASSSAGSTSSSAGSTSSSAGSTSTSDGGSSAAASTTGASATGSGPIVNGLSSVSAPLGSATAAGSTSATASSSASQAASSASESVTSAANTGTAPASASSSSAASSAASAGGTPAGAAAFTVPGKKLSVLPIGLGVFAGISVIALIVVGLVTYERTKYRKAFRQRKLAEQGGAMGYGGMVDRI